MIISKQTIKGNYVAYVPWSYYQAFAKTESEAIKILIEKLHLRVTTTTEVNPKIQE